MSLLRPTTHVVNQTAFPDWEVTGLVQRAMRGDPHAPPTVIVHARRSPSDNREGFTPFDRNQPVDIWVEPAARYPEGKWAPNWQTEVFLSAAHEDHHWRHGDRLCPDNRCETAAESYARQRLRLFGLGPRVEAELAGEGRLSAMDVGLRERPHPRHGRVRRSH